MTEYNPYDLIPMLIDGKEIMGRPIEFDSEVVDNMKMLNAFGNIIKPTKLSTCCPECGQGLQYDVYLAEPPFTTVSMMCYICNPEAPPQADPFMNPIDEGRIPEHELDPLLHDPNQQVVDKDYITEPAGQDGTTVADRLNIDDGLHEQKGDGKSTEDPKKAASKKSTQKPSKAKKTKKKAKKKPPKAKKKPVNKKASKEPAEGVGGEEQDLDDLVEQE